MISRSEALIIAKEEIRKGNMTVAQANVYMVQLEGVHIVSGKITKEVRAALNEAVKVGELGHIKKEGLRPEAYHHKNGRANALEARDRIYREDLSAMKNIYA